MSETEQVEEVETVACGDCGDQHDQDKMHAVASGSTVCESCLDNYSSCEDCAESYGMDEVYSVNGGDTIVCADCRGSNYYHCDDCDEWDSEYGSSVGGYGQVCQSCLDDNYGYCGECDEYYHNDNGCGENHDGCDCEAPAQQFTIRNDGDDPLKNDTRVSVQLPAGNISSEGVQAISRLISLHARKMDYSREKDNWYNLSYALDKIGDQWQAKDGNYTKRLSRFAYKTYGFKVPADMLSEIGNIGRDHSTAVDFAIEVTRNLNLSAYEFGHEESCWWGSYSDSRCTLKSNGGFGLRTFRDSSYSSAVKGRAWVLPLKLNDSGELVPTFNTETPAAFVVFNGYGDLRGYAPARLMAHMAGMTYRKISFSASPIYVNSETGYLIAPEEIASNFTDGSLDLNVDEHSRLYASEQLHKKMAEQVAA